MKYNDCGFPLDACNHMLDYAEANRTAFGWRKRPNKNKAYTEACVSAFYDELVDQAKTGRNPRIFTGFAWRQLNAIAGPYAYEVFDILRERGWLKSRIIPNTYGHEEYELAR